MSPAASVSASPPEQASSSSLSWCCGPLIAFLRPPHHQYHEKMPSAVVADQPESHPKPLFGLGRRSESLNLSRLSKSPKKNSGANSAGGNNRFTFANRLRNPSDASSRRPLISAPTEFRHLDSGSGFLHQPSLDQPLLDQPSVRRGTASPERNRRPHGIDNEPGHRQTSVTSNTRPLELSIHMPHNRLSSLLPRFEVPTLSPSPTPTPPPAYARDESTSAYPSHASATLRSYPSSFSFHLPRKHHRDSPPGSPTGEAQMSAPRAKKGRPRSNTSSGVEAMKERVANAMREMEDLQKQIDDVVERQSMYSHSRPSSAHSMARTVPDMEPMPSIPAMPPSAPSFAERLQGGDIDRPHTAPVPPANAPVFSQRESSLLAGRHEHPANTTTNLASHAGPPPLPLVLRPPLRKKKSFSRVSRWLFSEQSHSKPNHGRTDSVTNVPRPLKGKEGFYQSITMPDVRQSIESLRSHSTTDDEESENGISNGFQTCSQPPPRDGPSLERCSTFGSGREHVRMSVGVAI